jgi:hypothetical protein
MFGLEVWKSEREILSWKFGLEVWAGGLGWIWAGGLGWRFGWRFGLEVWAGRFGLFLHCSELAEIKRPFSQTNPSSSSGYVYKDSPCEDFGVA